MNTHKTILATAVLTALSTQAIAQSNIPTIVVTNARYAQDLDDVIGSTTVISRKEIEESQAQTVAELLQSKAGVTVINAGGDGQQTDVSLRGTSREQTLLIVDGVRINADNSETYWQTLNPENIERIEIVRGAKSSLYGSDAIGGVIQIFTKKQNGYNIKLTGGSFKTKDAHISLGTQKENMGFSILANKSESDGFSRTNKKIPSVYDKDNDGYKKQSGNLNFWVKFTPDIKATINLSQNKSIAGQDPFTLFNLGDNEIEYSADTATVNFEQKINSIWSQSFQVSKAKINYAVVNDISHSKTTDSSIDRNQINWQHDFNLKSHKLSVGFDQLKEEADSKGFFAYQEGTKNKSLYVNLSSTINKIQYDIGIRGEDHSLFGKHTTGNIDLQYNINNNWNTYASYSTGFRAPNITELYLPFTGNQDLKPEESVSGEIGFKHSGNNSNFIFSVFKTNIKNEIDYNPAVFKTENIKKTNIIGAEIGYQKSINDWDFSVAYTHQQVRDDDNNDLDNRPKQKLSFDITRSFSKGFMKLSSLSVSDVQSTDNTTYDFATGSFKKVTLAGYSVFNLSGKYYISRDLSLGLKIDNLLNKEYENVYGYNTAERSYYVTLEYKGSNW